MKRFFDFMSSLMGLIFLLPVFIVVVWVIKKDKGPVFFQQQRVGKYGKIFNIYKFRSMIIDADKLGAKVTASYDLRITRIGKLLRKTKIDELPQLFNVLMGDISLVGPRPEVPYYVAKWPDACKKTILSVKPGITDYATLYYNDEQAVLAKADDPEKAYLNEVMPHKLEMYKQYVKEQSFWLDIRIILATLLKMVGFGKKSQQGVVDVYDCYKINS
ncbi:sugar transferase [Desulfobacula toluolica]|uniref:Putative sugar transferase n=1 Tax=Desulfobacula toluolica (strain DSM 7467 / Tol2) TaxID=651182 RepID=K0NDU1_DESTT|nr:sugar transferase [Desulfobacula toluolica]CCK78975.1 putative sugar transferase [Desulfobacula toluolica Tol2]